MVLSNAKLFLSLSLILSPHFIGHFPGQPVSLKLSLSLSLSLCVFVSVSLSLSLSISMVAVVVTNRWCRRRHHLQLAGRRQEEEPRVCIPRVRQSQVRVDGKTPHR